MKGQTLTEILVAVAVAMIIISVSTSAIITSLSNAQASKNQNQASKYAQEAIEVVRQMRDTNWNSFDQLSGKYCMAKGCTTLSNTSGNCGPAGSCAINVDTFSRAVTIDRDAGQCNPVGNVGSLTSNRVTVNVSWSDGKCASGVLCRAVTLVSCLANLYGDPTL